MKNRRECIITGSNAITFNQNRDEVNYSIQYFDKTYTFHFCPKCYNKKEFRDYSHIIRSVILNNGLSEISNKLIHWGCDETGGIYLKEELNQISYPKTPKEKMDYLINCLYKLQSYDGELVNRFDSEKLWRTCYFKNKEEFFLYLDTINENRLIYISRNNVILDKFKFKYKGIDYLVNLSKESTISKKCFVAMAFDEKTKKIREAIRQSIKETGFEPDIIDENHLSSDKTINDAIISNIRSCKFCIADFTLHKHGVYFESGFALGLGKPVIYLCRKDEFRKAHFDIKPLQHIIYETEEELTVKLIDKINAWII